MKARWHNMTLRLKLFSTRNPENKSGVYSPSIPWKQLCYVCNFMMYNGHLLSLCMCHCISRLHCLSCISCVKTVKWNYCAMYIPQFSLMYLMIGVCSPLRTLHLSHISSLMLAWCKEGTASCLTEVLCSICCCTIYSSIQDLYRPACCVGLCLAGLDPLW